jgi:hypothetical protein
MCKYLTISLELPQKSDIWILEVAHIRYTISYHDETIEPESKCESRIYLRVEPSFTDDIRMDKSSTHEFYPARSLTYTTSIAIAEWTREVYFYSWFHEWEISRTHTDSYFFSEEI